MTSSIASSERLAFGAIADDVTGASDLANTLVRGGLSTVLAMGVPGDEKVDADAVVVALKTRTVPAAQAVEQSLAAYGWLAARRPAGIMVKYCSTFDSTDRGNIGPVVEAVMDACGATLSVVCPAFPTNRRTVYKGRLFVGDVPLDESSMRDHPLTPMRDANLVRLLTPQTLHKVGLVPWETVAKGTDAIAQALGALAADGVRHAVVDAITDADLVTIAKAAWGRALLTGGSGIAIGVPSICRTAGLSRNEGVDQFPQAQGPSIVLAGSCSAATNGQVTAFAATGHKSLKLDPVELADDSQTVAHASDWVRRESRPDPDPRLFDRTAGRAARGSGAYRNGSRRGARRKRPRGDRAGRRRCGGRAHGRRGRRDLGRRDPGARRQDAAHRTRDRSRRAVDGDPRQAAARPRAQERKFRRGGFFHARLRGPAMMNEEARLREEIVLLGRSLFERGFGVGTSGNLSARLDDGYLATPTNSCLGRLDAERLSKLDGRGQPISGDAPTKELPLHFAVYGARPDDRAVVHLHSTYATAVASLADADPANALPPITAYQAMRFGRLPIAPYFRPGEPEPGRFIAPLAASCRALLLANHGSLASAPDMASAVAIAEEVEESCKLFMILRGSPLRRLTQDQLEELAAVFGP